jgi:hypothetical protein
MHLFWLFIVYNEKQSFYWEKSEDPPLSHNVIFKTPHLNEKIIQDPLLCKHVEVAKTAIFSNILYFNKQIYCPVLQQLSSHAYVSNNGNVEIVALQTAEESG